ncbi:hypothetical protein A2U01_0069130, partial [Trifolium medium]|nr:hypothetical protein [Trifolium medium]
GGCRVGLGDCRGIEAAELGTVAAKLILRGDYKGMEAAELGTAAAAESVFIVFIGDMGVLWGSGD